MFIQETSLKAYCYWVKALFRRPKRARSATVLPGQFLIDRFEDGMWPPITGLNWYELGIIWYWNVTNYSVFIPLHFKSNLRHYKY